MRGFYAAMRPYVSGFAYQNYIDPELASWKHAYYSTNYARLQEVKAQVDPGRFFRFAPGIVPDAAVSGRRCDPWDGSRS